MNKLTTLSTGRWGFACILIVSATLTAGCNLLGGGPGGATAESDVTITFANTSRVQPDPTALINYGPGIQGCVADGASQPFSPALYGWQSFGSSPAAGKCFLSNLSSSGNAQFEYQSLACLSSGQPWDFTQFQSWSNGIVPAFNVCTVPSFALPQADSHFAATNLLPGTVTLHGSALSAAYGAPQLLAYNLRGTLAGSAIASSVASDGSSATFPFPSATAGGALASDFYMFAAKNKLDASGDFKLVTATYYSVGSPTTLSGVFGADAADVTVWTWWCTPGTGGTRCAGSSSSSTVTTPTPFLTQYYANQATYSGHTFPTGTEPVAVKLYGSATVLISNTPTFKQTRTGPTNAIVVNSGSNSVTILDLVHNTVVTTIAVGAQPMAVTVNSGKAYVANYGSSTVSEINLSTLAVTRTANIGSAPQAVAMDPSGSAVWVGGSGYLQKVDLTSFAVTTTYSMSGTVTSLAASNQQNELVYTLVSSSCCSSGSTYSATDLQLSNLTAQGSYGGSSASNYTAYTMNNTLPNPSVVSTGSTQVSVQWGNGMAASATPTGFVVYDVVSHKEIMKGTTPTPVRGIASNPSNTVMYLTLPDSNEYITVPLPHS